MELTQKIQKAINIATEKHLGQVRKWDGLPYITHPFTVAVLLSDYTDNEDVICAGLLHDVLEGVKDYGFAKLEKDFGWNVAGIVKEVSEDKDPDIEYNQKATWKRRKEGYLKHLKKASEEAMLVCAADKIHNLLSMIASYEEQGDKMWEQFNASPEECMWFYKECLDILRKALDNRIVKHLGYAYVLAEHIIFGDINVSNSEYTEIDDVISYKTMLNTKRSVTIKCKPKNPIKDISEEFNNQFKPKETKTEDERQAEVIRKHWEFYKFLCKKGFKNL